MHSELTASMSRPVSPDEFVVLSPNNRVFPVMPVVLDAESASRVVLGVIPIHEGTPTAIAALTRVHIAARKAILVVALRHFSAAGVQSTVATDRGGVHAHIFVEVHDRLPFQGSRGSVGVQMLDETCGGAAQQGRCQEEPATHCVRWRNGEVGGSEKQISEDWLMI